MVRLAFYRGRSLYGWAIRAWTLGPYSHVELVIDDMSFSSIENKGSRYLLYPVQEGPLWDLVDIPMTSAQQSAVWAWCMSEMGYGYDWKGIWLSQIVGLRREDPEKWFCSEFCSRALQEAGLLKGVKPCTVSPNRLARLIRNSHYSFT